MDFKRFLPTTGSKYAGYLLLAIICLGISFKDKTFGGPPLTTFQLFLSNLFIWLALIIFVLATGYQIYSFMRS